jgi:hypothetical protein
MERRRWVSGGEDQDRASSASGGVGSGRSTPGRQQAAAAHRGSAEVSYGWGSMERMRGTEIGVGLVRLDHVGLAY